MCPEAAFQEWYMPGLVSSLPDMITNSFFLVGGIIQMSSSQKNGEKCVPVVNFRDEKSGVACVMRCVQCV